MRRDDRIKRLNDSEPDLKYIGVRLKKIRKELHLSQEEVGAILKIKLQQKTISEIETYGKGKFITLLFEYYHSRGYNLNWIIIEDNEIISKTQISARELMNHIKSEGIILAEFIQQAIKLYESNRNVASKI